MASPLLLPQDHGHQQQQQSKFKEPAPPAAASGGDGHEESELELAGRGGRASTGDRRKSRGTLATEQRQQSKWGFVPGDEDTMMLELDRHGKQLLL
jgi:hypothetical protein